MRRFRFNPFRECDECDHHVQKIFKKICANINLVVEYLLFGIGFSMAILVAVQVFCRYVLNSSLFWPEELARYMLVWLSFLGATVAYYRKLHPGVDTITSKLSAPQQRLSRLLVHIITMACAATMVISGVQFSWFIRMQVSPALSIHKWIILIIIPLSGILFFTYAVLFFLQTFEQEDS